MHPCWAFQELCVWRISPYPGKKPTVKPDWRSTSHASAVVITLETLPGKRASDTYSLLPSHIIYTWGSQNTERWQWAAIYNQVNPAEVIYCFLLNCKQILGRHRNSAMPDLAAETKTPFTPFTDIFPHQDCIKKKKKILSAFRVILLEGFEMVTYNLIVIIKSIWEFCKHHETWVYCKDLLNHALIKKEK